jgi:hypothetical protein
MKIEIYLETELFQDILYEDNKTFLTNEDKIMVIQRAGATTVHFIF